MQSAEIVLSRTLHVRGASGKLYRYFCYGDPKVVTPEIPGLADQLNANNSEVRTQASAFLVTIARIRPDSSVVLSSAVTSLIDHVHDSGQQTRQNCVDALATMKPEISKLAIPVLLSVTSSDDGAVFPGAVFGLSRLANLNAEAAVTLDQILSQSSGTEKQKIVLAALGRAGVTNRQLVVYLGTFLSHKDADLRRTALLAINELGPDAVNLNRSQLTIFAETSSDQEMASLAHRLLNP